MKPRSEELWIVNVWISINRLYTQGKQWLGQVQIEFASGFVVVAAWVGDDGDTTGRLTDWRCEDEATFDAAVAREEEFAKAISSALRVDDTSSHVIATQADVEAAADSCWAA
jgi:hypothetical protein